jgi:hypothetical protein
MMVASVVLAVVQSRKGDHSWELFNIVIMLGLASKALFNVLLVKNYREGASRIIMAVGLLVSGAGPLEAALVVGIVLAATRGVNRRALWVGGGAD